VFAIALLLFAVGCESGQEAAALALRRNEPGKALALLDPLKPKCSQSSAFYELLGLANQAAGNAPEAEDAFRTAASMAPRSSRVLTELGAAYLRNAKAAAAAKVLDQALALDPSNAITLKYAIGAAVQLQDWQRAAGFFHQIGADAAPAVLQEEPILMLWFAQTLIETHRGDQIDTLLSLKQDHASAQLVFSLGTLFARYRMYTRAVKYLRRVPAESADDALYFNLGLCYSHLNQFPEARKCYFRAVDLHPRFPDAYLHVGLDYTSSGEPRTAVPWLIRAHSLAPNRTDIAYALAEQLLRLEYFDTAEEILVPGLEAHPLDALLLVAHGDLKRAELNLTAATASYERALSVQPGLAPALVGLARTNVAQHKDGAAKEILKNVLSRDAEEPSANAELGLLEAHEGEWQPALEHLSRAWAQDRSNTAVALELARTYRRVDRPAEALDVLTSFGAGGGESAAFHYELAQIYTRLHRPVEAQAEREAFSRIEAQSQSGLLRFESPRKYLP
jgi:Flp pilus assembly protein TadD